VPGHQLWGFTPLTHNSWKYGGQDGCVMVYSNSSGRDHLAITVGYVGSA